MLALLLLSRKEVLSSPNLEVVVAELVSPNLEFGVDVSPYLEASELAGRADEAFSPYLEVAEAGSPNLEEVAEAVSPNLEAAEAGLSTVFRLSLQE